MGARVLLEEVDSSGYDGKRGAHLVGDEAEKLVPRFGCAHEFGGTARDGLLQLLCVDFQGAALGGSRRRSRVCRAREGCDEVVPVDGFLDEVVGAAAERLDGEVVFPWPLIRRTGVSGCNDEIWASRARPSIPRHLDVGDHRVVFDFGEAAQSRGRRSSQVWTLSEGMRSSSATGEASSRAGSIVIDD